MNILSPYQYNLLQLSLTKWKTFIPSYILHLLNGKCNEYIDKFIKYMDEHGDVCTHKNKLTPILLLWSQYNNLNIEDDNKLDINYIESLGIDITLPNIQNYNHNRNFNNRRASLIEDEIKLYKHIMSLILRPTEYITTKGLVTINFDVDLFLIIQSNNTIDIWFRQYIVDELQHMLYILYVQHS